MPWTVTTTPDHSCAMPTNELRTVGEGSIWECAVCHNRYVVQIDQRGNPAFYLLPSVATDDDPDPTPPTDDTDETPEG